MKHRIKFFRYDGKNLTIREWSKICGLNEATLYYRLVVYGWGIKESLLTKARAKREITNNLIILNAHEKINTETIEDEIFIHPTICKTFGCKEELSLQEKLFGSKCTRCQRQEIKIIR